MNHNNIKRIRERLEPWFTKGEVSHTHLATKWTVAPCCTAKKGKMKSPKKWPKERKPRECLQTACTAVSSSIAVNLNASVGDQPDVEWASFAD